MPIRPFGLCGTTPHEPKSMLKDTSMIFTNHIKATRMSGIMRLPRNFFLSALLSMSSALSRIVPLRRSEKMADDSVYYDELSGYIANP